MLLALQKMKSSIDLLVRVARQLAWGIDAASRLRHGIDVPPDHGARRRVR